MRFLSDGNLREEDFRGAGILPAVFWFQRNTSTPAPQVQASLPT